MPAVDPAARALGDECFQFGGGRGLVPGVEGRVEGGGGEVGGGGDGEGWAVQVGGAVGGGRGRRRLRRGRGRGCVGRRGSPSSGRTSPTAFADACGDRVGAARGQGAAAGEGAFAQCVEDGVEQGPQGVGALGAGGEGVGVLMGGSSGALGGQREFQLVRDCVGRARKGPVEPEPRKGVCPARGKHVGGTAGACRGAGRAPRWGALVVDWRTRNARARSSSWSASLRRRAGIGSASSRHCLAEAEGCPASTAWAGKAQRPAASAMAGPRRAARATASW